MANYDRFLEACEDRWARFAFEDDEDRVVFLDEYGRHPDHPDHGYSGPSIDKCPHCGWIGDALSTKYLCPDCNTMTERDD